MNVAIVGLGFIGLTLALSLADKGVKVFGVEKDQKTFSTLSKGIPTLKEKGIQRILERNIGKNFQVFQSIEEINSKIHSFIICVATPINNEELDINQLKKASEDVGKNITDNELIIIRSTVPIGTTRKVIIPIIEKELKKKGMKESLNIVYAPERTAEGIALRELNELPQIVGGINEISIIKAMDLFRNITSTVIQASSIETAEMIKLIDNSFRDVRFAYSNEIALLCEQIGIDAHECITKSNIRYSRNNVALPSPGVGGPCLSKDPYLLMSNNEIKEFVKNNQSVILTGRTFNESVPKHLAKKIIKKIKKKNDETIKIFVMGFAFKGEPETSDVRQSPTLHVIKELKSDFQIFGHDPVVPKEIIENTGAISCSLEEGFKNANCVIIMNNHKFYRNLDIIELLKNSSKPCIFVDCWRLYDKNMFLDSPNIEYSGVGIV